MMDQPKRSFWLSPDFDSIFHSAKLAVSSLGIAFGFMPGLVAAAAVVLVSHLRDKAREREYTQKFIDYAGNDIGLLVGKPANEVTLKDVASLATGHNPTGQKLTAVTNFLENMHQSDDASMMRTGLTLVGGLALSALGVFNGLANTSLGSAFGPRTISLGLSFASTKVINMATETVFPKRSKPDLLIDLETIVKASRSRLLQGSDLIGLFFAANAPLNAKLVNEYGKPFAELPLFVKHRIVDEYEPLLKTKALAHAINQGAIPVSAMLYLPYGDGSGLPAAAAYQGLQPEVTKAGAAVSPPDSQVVVTVQPAIHAAKIAAERENRPAGMTLH